MSFSKLIIPVRLNAFLDVIGHSEGTIKVAGSDDGYNVLFGRKLFQSYCNHPAILTTFRDKKGRLRASTAAGRYQEKEHNYIFYKKKLGLQDFGPRPQDEIAIQHIKECSALQLILEGHFELGIEKCKNIWASFPGAGYSQHENSLESLKKIYEDVGGTFAV